MPWLYMIAIYLTIPDSSFLGHFCGLIAGLLIKFAGVYVFMPSFDTLSAFDETLRDDSMLEKNGYYRAKEAIETDFTSWLWKTLANKAIKGV